MISLQNQYQEAELTPALQHSKPEEDEESHRSFILHVGTHQTAPPKNSAAQRWSQRRWGSAITTLPQPKSLQLAQRLKDKVLWLRSLGADAQTAAGRTLGWDLTMNHKVSQLQFFGTRDEHLFESPNLNLNSIFLAIMHQD